VIKPDAVGSPEVAPDSLRLVADSDLRIVSGPLDLPSIPAHSCAFRNGSFTAPAPPNAKYVVVDYVPPPIVVQNIQQGGDDPSWSATFCNVSAAPFDAPGFTLRVLAFDS
jgi:hypothetical protein